MIWKEWSGRDIRIEIRVRERYMLANRCCMHGHALPLRIGVAYLLQRYAGPVHNLAHFILHLIVKEDRLSYHDPYDPGILDKAMCRPAIAGIVDDRHQRHTVLSGQLSAA